MTLSDSILEAMPVGARMTSTELVDTIYPDCRRSERWQKQNQIVKQLNRMRKFHIMEVVGTAPGKANNKLNLWERMA